MKRALWLNVLSLTVLLHTASSAVVNEQQSLASDFGTAGYSSGPDGWYTISTNSYPAATPMSQLRNKGVSSGAVYLAPTGLTLGVDGDYEVSVTAVIQNPSEDTSLLIPVYLSVDGQGDPVRTEIDPEDPNPVGGVGVITATDFTTVHGTGILKGVEAGTRLSVVATNAGYPEAQDVTVISWAITANKLP